jgi:hypothetical protein
MKRVDGSTSKLQRSLEMYAQEFMTSLGIRTLKEKDEIENKLGKVLGTILFFLDPTCKEIAGGSLTPKNIWKTLKNQLEGHESYTKIYLLILLYTTKLEEGSLDIDGYVKLMDAIWRRLNDVNLRIPEELVVLMTLRVLLHLSGLKEEFWNLKKAFP